MKVYYVQLLFYFIAVHYMINLINSLNIPLHREKFKKKIEHLKLLVKAKEGKLIQQSQVQLKCCQYFT